MPTFLDSIKTASNRTYTENGAETLKTSQSHVLDFFALAGAMRDRPQEAVRLFINAFGEDKVLAVRALFYLRDIRGGQGERKIFRECLKVLSSEQFSSVAPLIPEYGRWDEVLTYVENPTVVKLVENTLNQDIINMHTDQSVSLLAKWMPSANTSSKETRALASKWRKALGLQPKQYRQALSSLRAKIKLLEHNMSNKTWGEVDYSKLPSQALRKHIKAAKRNDEKRFTAFVEKVNKGEAKVNAGTIFPYELVEMLVAGTNDDEIQALWSNLPDYTNGKNALVIADTSASMYGHPMNVALSLALYFAERNTLPFKDYFMTFSESPQLVHIPADLTISQKIQGMDLGIVANTDLQKAFELVLEAGLAADTKAEDMPETLYVISDMEFDYCVEGGTNFENIKAKFLAHGFKLPHVVFWNVEARNTQLPVERDEGNVSLFSGSSAATFKLAVSGMTPYETMLEVLNSDRYSPITLEV